MTPFVWSMIALVVFDLFIALVVVRSMAKSVFGPIVSEFPAIEPGDVHTERKRQSFSLGLMNFGFSVRVRLDDTHLHLSPEPWMRWTGMPAMSIPLSELNPKGLPRKSWLAHPIEINTNRTSKDLRSPKWLWEELNLNA